VKYENRIDNKNQNAAYGSSDAFSTRPFAGRFENYMTDFPEEPTDAGLAIIEAVENQLESGEPPETRETLDRLMALGEERENAIKFIASAMIVEVFGAVKHSQPYDEKRYISNLNKLPDLSFLDE